MKKFLLITLFGSVLLVSCNFSANTSSNAKDNTEAKVKFHSVSDVVGKTVAYQYGESIYHVTFDTDSTMHWEAVAGDEKGALEYETYVAEFIEPDLMFISWGEENGINVSQVLDFKNGKVYNHLVKNRVASAGDGLISIVEK